MKYTLNIILLFVLFQSSAQNEGNIWYFGDSAGVDFNSGTPVALTNGSIAFANHTDFMGFPINYNEGTSVISDYSGNLLFYSDGQTVWNQNHQIMLNGDSLFGNFSSTQSSVIIPQPNSKELYYIFTIDDVWESTSNYGFRYSVVDMCEDNGNGMVIPAQKNILLLDGAYEKLGAVRHSNGVDYWVVTHKLNTNKYYSYLLNQTGISDTVVSVTGAVSTYGQGQLKFSPNGQRMAVVHNQHWVTPIEFELFDFDNSTGIISNPIGITTSGKNVYGIEFSPNSNILYAVFTKPSPTTILNIMQYDILISDSITINNSQTSVYQANLVSVRGLQLAPNDKIYMVSISNADYLLSINNPNILGVGCNVIDNDVYLAGRAGDKTLPTFVAGYSYDNLNFISCEASLDDVSKNHPKVEKIIDTMGRETEDKPNTLLIYVYSDGTTKKVYRTTP